MRASHVVPELLPPVGSHPPGAATTATAGPEEFGVLVFFLVGLLGGAHCLGMCGPLVTMYGDELGDDRGTTFVELRQHLLLHAGRTAGYALVGALMGALGMVLYGTADVVSLARGVRAVVGVAVGLFVLGTGAAYLLRGTGPHGVLGGVAPDGGTPGAVGSAFHRVHGALSARIRTWAHGPRIVVLGGLHAALPCPLLYPAFLYALAIGSPAAGAANLAALGVGTMPTLFAYGVAVGSVSTSWRVRLHRALGAAFLVLGYLPLSMGLRAAGVAVPTLPVPFYQPLG